MSLRVTATEIVAVTLGRPPTMVLVETPVLAVAATKPKLAKGALDTLNDLRSQIAGRHLPVDPP